MFGWVENKEEKKEIKENDMFSIVWLRREKWGEH